MYIDKKLLRASHYPKGKMVFGNEALFSLHYTFVFPYPNYCIHVWGKAYDTHLNHLKILQERVICIMNGQFVCDI